MSSSKSKSTTWSEWRDLVNIAPQELEDWPKTQRWRLVGDEEDGESTGHQSGRRIATSKRTNKDALSHAQWDHMAKVVGYIKRHLSQGGPEKDVASSVWRYSSMNWGHP